MGWGNGLIIASYLSDTLNHMNDLRQMTQGTNSSRTQTILIVEDDTSINGLLALRLGKAGYQTLQAFDAESGLQLFVQHQPELVVADLMLPKMNGWDFIRELRQVSLVPILVLTARNLERDELRGLALGADEYITKPFNFAKLLARIEALLRRSTSGGTGQSASMYQDSAVTIDYWRREVTVRGKPISLSPIEYKLLLTLVRHYGQVLTSEQLLAEVWGPGYEQIDSVKAYVSYLRRKIERDPERPELIRTAWGVGYSYEALGEGK